MCFLKYLIEKTPININKTVIEKILIGIPRLELGKRMNVSPHSPKMLRPKKSSYHIMKVITADAINTNA